MLRAISPCFAIALFPLRLLSLLVAAQTPLDDLYNSIICPQDRDLVVREVLEAIAPCTGFKLLTDVTQYNEKSIEIVLGLIIYIRAKADILDNISDGKP